MFGGGSGSGGERLVCVVSDSSGDRHILTPDRPSALLLALWCFSFSACLNMANMAATCLLPYAACHQWECFCACLSQ